jgi:pimeloyl-ACP methyl ester carboxylesterase
MPSTRVNGLNIHYEVTGEGFPIVFCHEFAGDYRAWEPQVRYFSRLYRCVTFSFRGFPPSDVPERPEDYSQDLLLQDTRALLEHLDIKQAHMVGFSMGGSVVLNFAIRWPELCRSVVAVGAGSGATNREQFEHDVDAVCELIRARGMEAYADTYGAGPTRQQFKRKDPSGWKVFRDRLAEHSPIGQPLVFVGVVKNRPTLFQLEQDFDRMEVPTLIMLGDEDEPCVDVGVFLKRHIRSSGLAIVPQTGHTVNLEEPALCNELVHGFLNMVEAGKWASRAKVTTAMLP